MAEKMRRLWLSNIIFPEVSDRLGLPRVVVGSWMMAYKSLLQAKRNAPEIISNQEVISIYQNGLLVARKRIDAKRAHWL